VNFRPNKMTVEELEDGLRWLYSEVYNETELTRRQRHCMDIVKQRRVGLRTAAPAAGWA